MKLKRLKLNVPYKSLQAGFEIEFKPNLASQTIDPICFVGPNGSGKSNVLEALADIFYYLECDLIGYTAISAYKTPIEAFEIEFYKPFLASNPIVLSSDDLKSSASHIVYKIVKNATENPSYYLLTDSSERLIEKKLRHYVLPKRIWGYSSGENETLSLPFRRMDIFYLEQATINLQKKVSEIIKDNRLHFIDYETTGALILSNFLMNRNSGLTSDDSSSKLTLFKERFGIEGVSSFKITIRFRYKNKFNMPIDKAVQRFIDTLEENFSSSAKERKKTDPLVISVDLNKPESFTVFDKLASDAAGLYQYFEKLIMRNKYVIPWKRRQDVLYSKDVFQAHNNIGSIPDDEMLFTIDELMLKKEGLDEPIAYKSISDGEHQALTIFSLINLIDENDVLCLFDEPETHLNPKWKYEYINTINDIQKQTDSQIIITTHDPIFISGLAKEQVILFNKRNNELPDQKRCSFAEEDLIGQGVDSILTSDIFGFQTTVDSFTQEQLIDRRILLVKKIKSHLTEEENERLKTLSESLSEIDYANPVNDPLYTDFIDILEDIEFYTKKTISPEERVARKERARVALEKLKKYKTE